MKNCLILGSGRTGTSMLAGCLANAGYFMGENLYPGRDTNPKGFYEAPEINGINEAILEQITPNKPPFIGRFFFKERFSYGQRWLARVALNTKIPTTEGINRRIERLVETRPFCFKDPRFSYTLPVWRPYLADTRFLCVFRSPAVTAASIIKECQTAKYLKGLRINYEDALAVWILMYRHILELHCTQGEWLFIHYDQILNGDAGEKVSAFLEADFDYSFPEVKYKRTRDKTRITAEAKSVYDKLCEMADFDCDAKDGSP